MTDSIITAVGDATLREARPSLPDAAGTWVRVDATTGARMRGLLVPELGDILGRNVEVAMLSGRVGPGHVAQTYTMTPYLTRRSPGKATWTNEPATDDAAAFTVPQTSALPDGGVVQFNLLSAVQAVADGADWFGVQLKTNSTAANQLFYSSDSGDPAWELHLVLSDIPDPPTDLRPNGGAVKDGEPILAWFRDSLGGDAGEQTEARVQVDTPAAAANPDEVAPDHDSGWHARSVPEYDLAAVTYTPPASPPGSTYWRVATDKNPDGSPIWSDWADFTVAALPTLVMDSPVGAFGDTTPVVIAHLTGGTLASWKAFATGPDRSDVRANAELQEGAINWQIPFRNADGRRVLKTGEQDWVYVRAYDTVDRAVAVGQKAFVDAWVPVNLVSSPTLTAVTNLVLTQLPNGDARHIWEWQRTEAATGWVIEIDGEEAERLEPEDVTGPIAGVYTWQDYGHIAPLRPHTLRVRAIDDATKQTSAGASLSNRKHTVEGVWLLPDPLLALPPIKLSGTVVGGWAREDRAATYVPLQGPEVDIIYDTPLRVGSFEGTIDYQQDVWAAQDTIAKLRADKRRRARLIWGSQSQLVRLRSPDATSHDEINSVNLMHAVRFGFVGLGA